MIVVASAWTLALVYNLICIAAAPRLTFSGKNTFRHNHQPVLPPKVSIIVPARNEAGRILKQSIASMLAQDYPNFEVIVTDDRSSDATLSILNEIARDDKRLIVVEGLDLPAGWFGKPWALAQARAVATGYWLVSTDADMIFHPSVLSSAMEYAMQHGLDALTLAPALSTEGFWPRLMMPVAGWLILILYPYWKVNSPKSKTALGIGGFFLMKRSAHDKTGSYDAIRNEVVDDVKTAELLKHHGFRMKLIAGTDFVSTPMYSTLAELFEGFGKNAFAGSGANPIRAILSAVLNLLFTLGPVLTALISLCALCLTRSPQMGALMAASVAAYLAMTLSFVPVYREAKENPCYAFISFFAHVVMVAILLYSTWRVSSGKGVVWKSRSIFISGKETPAEKSNGQ